MPSINLPPTGEPRRLAEIGYVLYGPYHIERLALLLGVDRRTVHRWRSGITPVPERVWADLKVALIRRKKQIEEYLQ